MSAAIRAVGLGFLALAALPFGGTPPPDLTPAPTRVASAPRPSQAGATVPPQAAPRRPPALVAQIGDDRPAEPLSIAKVEIEVVVGGFLAETSTTLTFRNDLDRVLEGELVFPLPEGATVSGFALDVAGELVDGVVVERHEARVAFEQEVRRGADPGLVEWVQGNNFRTRVWPIPAHGSRTVRVRYVSDLVTRDAADGLEALYALPLRYPGRVAEFGLRVEVVKGAAAPLVRAGGPANFRFARWEDRYVARTTLRDAALTEDLLVALPQVPRQNALIEQAEDGRTYFVIDDFPDLPPPREAAKPRRVALLWDASFSRRSAEHRRELALVEGWLRRLGEVQLDLVVVRDVAEPARAFRVEGGDASELLAFLGGLAYDGGTSLGALRVGKEYDYALLFSDGLGNLGDALPQALDAPVYAICGAARADHARLAYLAQLSGGAAFNLLRLSDDEVIAGLGGGGFSFLAAEHEPGAIQDLQPAGRRPVQGRFTLAGRLDADEARLTLRYGDGAPSQSRTYTLRRADAVKGHLASRHWAQQRVTELSIFAERHHDELLDLGRRFGIVTPGASLLVLETTEQYLAHGVEPPRSRARVYAEYRERVTERERGRKAKEADKLERVAAMWQRRVEWWQREFQYAADFRWAARDDGRDGQGRPRRAPADGAPPPGMLGGAAGAPREDAPAEPPRPAPTSLAAADERRELESRPSRAVAEPEAKKKESTSDGSTAARTIVLKPWDPDTPYLKAIRRVPPADQYAAYLVQRDDSGTSPAFFLDCADHFLRAGRRDLGLRILSVVVELELGEPRLLRIAAHRLQQVGELGLALRLFEEVLRLRPEEPQSLRDLALALEARADVAARKAGRGSQAIAADYQRALELLDRIVRGEWDGRFPEVELIALEEANRIAAVLERDPAYGRPSVPLDTRLRKLLDLDVRIVMTWDTDQTDMDLWVLEPSGEKCFYSHNLTTIGGTISRDFTGGYGPEEYLVRRAMPGDYKVSANFYGSRSQTLTGPTTVQATVITDFGRAGEKRQALTLRLTEAKDVVEIGAVRFGNAAAKITR